MSPRPAQPTSRRSFLQALAVIGVASRELLRTGDARGALRIAQNPTAAPTDWPSLERHPLGRTGFHGSRLVFGCGAALARGRRDELLETAFEAGINVFDSGTR